jgi:hypothetical protein
MSESEGLFIVEDDILKQILAFFSTKGISASFFPGSHPPTTESAIFIKSHLKK